MAVVFVPEAHSQEADGESMWALVWNQQRDILWSKLARVDHA